MLLAHTSFHTAMITFYMDLLSEHWDTWRRRHPDIHKMYPFDHLIFDSLHYHGYSLLDIYTTHKYSHTLCHYKKPHT